MTKEKNNTHDSTLDQGKLAAFGRSFFLLFNRSTMYDANHPFCLQAVDEFLPTIQDILRVHSHLVFIMNQEKFFVDEEPIDPRINTSKMVAHFKKAGIQSISFYQGLTRHDTMAFIEIFKATNLYSNAGKMKAELESRGIVSIKINHVFYKKVSKDEEVISRQTFEKMTLENDDGGPGGSKKMFMDMVLESVMMEEFEKTLTIKNITEHPEDVSKGMIEADLNTWKQSHAEDKEPGKVLVHQLQMMEAEVGKHLSGFGSMGDGTGRGPADGNGSGDSGSGDSGSAEGTGNQVSGDGLGEGKDGSAEMSDLAEAVFKMKKNLLDGIKLQKSLGTSYSNEDDIVDKANEITDKVMIQLVKNEYQSGKITPSRLAQLLKRLVPEVSELKRLMPQIKKALLQEGMPLAEYLNLVQELSHELQSEELSKVLQESAETVGLDGAELVQEIRDNPAQAAELIYLAAEIRKGGEDESVLSDILVEYVEQIGSKLALDTAKKENVEGDQHLRKVMDNVESQILGRLKKMDVNSDVIERLEEKLNSRVDKLFETFKDQWKHTIADAPGEDVKKDLSVLQILEKSAGDNEELSNILRSIRHEAESRDLDENDFKNVFDAIRQQKQDKEKQKDKKIKFTGVLDSEGLIFLLEKEISRAVRYDLPFATISFSVVSAKAEKITDKPQISQKLIVEAVLNRLGTELRGADMAALVDKNKLVGFLPMTPPDEAKLALNRHLRLLNTKPVEVMGHPVTIRVAGAITNFDVKRTPDSKAFYQAMNTDLTEMVQRIKNIHGLS